jgi:hypothetical protein
MVEFFSKEKEIISYLIMTRVYECKKFAIDVVLWGTYGYKKYDGTKSTL